MTPEHKALVERLRLGGPNAMEVATEAADAIEALSADLALLGPVCAKVITRTCEFCMSYVQQSEFSGHCTTFCTSISKHGTCPAFYIKMTRTK